MTKKPALGRGLAALLSDDVHLQPAAGERVREVDCGEIQPNPFQPRRRFDEEKLTELADSIRTYGVMQPLVVTGREGGYVIAAGERRFRAAQMAGLSQVPVLIRDLTDQDLAELSIIENIQREDLGPLEEAQAYQDLITAHGYTQEQLAARLGKSRPHIANTLRLLRLAPQDKKLLDQGQLTAGHCRALLSLTDARLRARLTQAILKENLSVRQAEQLAARLRQTPQPRPRSQAHILHQDLARQITATLGVKASITGEKGRGKVVLEYASEDDLENIIAAILE